MTTLHWTFSSRPTAIHAAAGVDAGLTPVDSVLASSIRQPLTEAVHRLVGLKVDRPTFWQQLIAGAASSDAMAHVVSTGITRAVGPHDQSTLHIELTDAISTIVSRAREYLVTPEELEVRSQPLELQWRTYGPGLLRLITNSTDHQLLTDEARLIVVQAIFGGGGSAHLYANAAHIEAMMINPDESLPEVLRLAWMISQLKNDLPIYSESINRWQLPTISGLAMIPATLEAADQLQLATYNRDMLQRAITSWLAFDSDPVLTREIVETWWDTARSGGYAWSAALQALDRMMRPLTCAAQ